WAGGKTLGALGFRSYITNRPGAHFHFPLFDGKTGEPQAWMQADYLGQVRTGAAGGVATKFMARPDCATVGIFGSGKQARTQLQAVCRVRPVKHAVVFSPNTERRAAFAAEMRQVCQIEVVPTANPEVAARNRDIVITATASRDPVLDGDWFSEGTHLNVIGSNFLGKAEIDAKTLKRVKKIAVDSKDQARIEAGDLMPAIEEGLVHWADVLEISRVVAGRDSGRDDPKQITMFKSLGLAIEDLAVAARVYALAKQQGIGKMLDV